MTTNRDRLDQAVAATLDQCGDAGTLAARLPVWRWRDAFIEALSRLRAVIIPQPC